MSPSETVFEAVYFPLSIYLLLEANELHCIYVIAGSKHIFQQRNHRILKSVILKSFSSQSLPSLNF